MTAASSPTPLSVDEFFIGTSLVNRFIKPNSPNEDISVSFVLISILIYLYNAKLDNKILIQKQI
jgi:hypothetical protein